MDDLERRFNRAMVSIYETSKRELGYNATRFVQMIIEQGGLTTAKQLLWRPTAGVPYRSEATVRSIPPCDGLNMQVYAREAMVASYDRVFRRPPAGWCGGGAGSGYSLDLCARLSVPPPRLLTTASGMSIRFTCGSRRGHQCCAGPRRITSR